MLSSLSTSRLSLQFCQGWWMSSFLQERFLHFPSKFLLGNLPSAVSANVIIPYNLLRLSVSDTLCSRTGLISNQQPFLRRFSAALTLWGLCCLRIAILSLPPFQLWVCNLLVLANLNAWVLWEMSKVSITKSSYPKSHSPVSLIICFRHYPCFLL